MSTPWRVSGAALMLVAGVLAAVALAQKPNLTTPEGLWEDTRTGTAINRASQNVPFPDVNPATSHDWPLDADCRQRGDVSDNPEQRRGDRRRDRQDGVEQHSG